MTAVSILLVVVLALAFAVAAGYTISAWRGTGRWALLAGGLLSAIITFVLVSALVTHAMAAWLQ